MKLIRSSAHVHPRGRWMLPIALGFSDGILNALVLASAAVLGGGDAVRSGLAVRVAIVAFLTAVFTVFVAEYSELRAELTHAEHELNLTSAGRLATTYLGRAVFVEGCQSASIAGGCSFAGSFVPLMVASVLSSAWSWVALLLGVATLGVLGAVIARNVDGHPWRWCAVMTLGGVIVTAIGVQLDIT